MALDESVAVPGKAEVVVEGVDGELIEFRVINLSKDPLVVDRNAIRLIHGRRYLRRMAGGIEDTYYVPPGGTQRVNCRFDLAALPALKAGAHVHVDFQYGLRIGGLGVGNVPRFAFQVY